MRFSASTSFIVASLAASSSLAAPLAVPDMMPASPNPNDFPASPRIQDSPLIGGAAFNRRSIIAARQFNEKRQAPIITPPTSETEAVTESLPDPSLPSVTVTNPDALPTDLPTSIASISATSSSSEILPTASATPDPLSTTDTPTDDGNGPVSSLGLLSPLTGALHDLLSTVKGILANLPVAGPLLSGVLDTVSGLLSGLSVAEVAEPADMQMVDNAQDIIASVSASADEFRKVAKLDSVDPTWTSSAPVETPTNGGSAFSRREYEYYDCDM